MAQALLADNLAQTRVLIVPAATRCFRRRGPRGSCDPWERYKSRFADCRAQADRLDSRLLDGDHAAACFSLLYRKGVLVLHS